MNGTHWLSFASLASVCIGGMFCGERALTESTPVSRVLGGGRASRASRSDGDHTMSCVAKGLVVVTASHQGRPCRSVACHAKSSGPGKQPPQSRGPGAAPLRMQTEDQRKFGYGGDGCALRGEGLCQQAKHAHAATQLRGS